MYVKIASLTITLPLCFALACSGTAITTEGTQPSPGTQSTGPDTQACATPGRTGQVVCGDATSTAPSCSAGNYCYQDEKRFFRCNTGCTSDQNCGPSEHCEKCGKNVGSCVACATPAADACKTVDAGGPGPDLPSGQCTRSNFYDLYCTDTTKAKAYECDDNAEPASDLNCAKPDDAPSWVYCCAK
jgi:hypothetical protein